MVRSTRLLFMLAFLIAQSSLAQQIPRFQVDASWQSSCPTIGFLAKSAASRSIPTIIFGFISGRAR